MLNGSAKMTDLPDDIAILKAMVSARDLALVERDGVVQQQLESIAQMQRTLQARALEIERLKLQIAKLKRMQFGSSSEKLDREIERLETRLEELEATDDEAEVAAELEQKKVKPRKPSTRRPLPAHLPREDHIYEPVEVVCPECAGELKPLGEDVAEQLTIIKAAFKVIRHIRRKKACVRCDCIVQAPAPSRPIERGIASAALLAHVIVSKFCDHLPLYRQCEIWAREGIDYDRSVMARQIGLCCALMRPLDDALYRYVVAPGKVHADDTTIPVLSPGNKKTKTGRLWVYVRDDRRSGSKAPPAVWFAYTPDRQGQHPQAHLADFTGVLQADAFAGYDALYKGGDVHEAACMAHARRKIHDLHVKCKTVRTTEALRRIGELYAIEAKIRGHAGEERKRVRQEKARPLLNSLETWLRAWRATLSAQTETAKAINYFMNHWPALTYYCDDGIAEIDNNIAENALRGCCLGRKNFLFVGADSGGERAAAMYSLIGTCKLNGIDPQAYLGYVLAHIADQPINRIEELLPWHVADKLQTTNSPAPSVS
jgi:transposase